TLDVSVVKWILKGCMLAFALLVVWTCRTPFTSRNGWRLAAEYSIVILGMLIFSERTWKHHCVTLVAPFAVLCYYLAVCRPTPVLRSVLIGLLALAQLFMALTSTSLLAHFDAKMAQVYGAYLWAICLLAAALFIILRRPDAPSAPLANP